MRIGIDARKLHDFGIGTYIRNLLRQLARLDHDTEFVLLSRPEDRETLASLTGWDLSSIRRRMGGGWSDRDSDSPKRPQWWEQMWHN